MSGNAHFVKPEPIIPFAKADPTPGGWTPQSKRTGVLAQKIGMLQAVTEWGEMLPCTMLQVSHLL